MTTKADPDGASGAAPDFLTPEEQAQEADAAQWQTVSDEDVEETKVTFDNMQEPFIGTYRGKRVIETAEGKFTQFLFENDGQRYFINAGWSLAQGMQKVLTGQLCRITWVNNRDTGQETPMRVMQVDVSKQSRNTKGARAQVMR